MEDILGVEPTVLPCSISFNLCSDQKNYLLLKHCRIIKNGQQHVVPMSLNREK